MRDLEVDDDEWQLSAWFLYDQNKPVPLATLDYHQNLFAVTGIFRIQEVNDDEFVVFSRDQFYNMFGPFPDTFHKESDMDQLVLCPYQYDVTNMEFTNTITGGHPLLFHFAGNDWLCACTVFAAAGFHTIPNKFRHNCEQRYSIWHDRIEDGIVLIAQSPEDTTMLYLYHDIEEDSASHTERRLEHKNSRMLQSYEQPYPYPIPYNNHY
jgi:hypothetical protein